MISDEPPELGMKGHELHIAYGLAVAGCPRVPPAPRESTRPVARRQATRLGRGSDRCESKQEDEPGRSPKAGVRGLHGPQSYSCFASRGEVRRDLRPARGAPRVSRRPLTALLLPPSPLVPPVRSWHTVCRSGAVVRPGRWHNQPFHPTGGAMRATASACGSVRYGGQGCRSMRSRTGTSVCRISKE